MSDVFQRFIISACLAGMAIGLNYLGEPVWSILPATAAVVVSGWLLYDVWRNEG
jgi:hypothetical protein